MAHGDTEIIKIKNCVLNTFTSNYFADGIPAIHADGTPHKTEITLNFTELQKLDRRDYK